MKYSTKTIHKLHNAKAYLGGWALRVQSPNELIKAYNCRKYHQIQCKRPQKAHKIPKCFYEYAPVHIENKMFLQSYSFTYIDPLDEWLDDVWVDGGMEM